MRVRLVMIHLSLKPIIICVYVVLADIFTISTSLFIFI